MQTAANHEVDVCLSTKFEGGLQLTYDVATDALNTVTTAVLK